MLPSELLITKTKKDRIHPVFVPLDAEHLELADELIDVIITLQVSTASSVRGSKRSKQQMNYK